MNDECVQTAPNPACRLLSPYEWLPPEAPLSMPLQSFGTRPVPARTIPWRFGETELWRMFALAAPVVAMALCGAASLDVFQVGGFTALELIAFGLFEILFGWIAYSLAIALIGCAGAAVAGPDPLGAQPDGPPPLLHRRTAVLMPIYNEEVEPVFARLRAMERSLRRVGAEQAFHLFVLSDSRDPELRRQEREAFQRLRRGMEGRAFYRARAENSGRKAGNIADWVRRFGGAYDHMVVLDADSLMSGEALARMAGAMEAEPGLGLLQTAPKLINRTGPFGRLQQFASRLYGPMMTEGVHLCWGSESNYWGHNAIIRVRAFADHCGLPPLRGPRPFGGEIMSHDFVEAALLRRAGWAVRLAPRLDGSYEECPPTLPDMIVRDRRWCQGNLQHVLVLGARGLHWMSRFHLAHGVMAYLMSPLWFAFLIVGACLSAERGLVEIGQWDVYAERVLAWVAAIAFLSLFIPRLLALASMLANPAERRRWGDPWRVVGGMVLETLTSVLVAPILMVSQTEALIEILRGKDSGWSAQTRDDGSIGWREAGRRHALHTLAGFALAGFSFWISRDAFFWIVPVSLGLVLSAPLSVLTAHPRVGALLLRWGLFVTPEEREPPLAEARPRPAPVLERPLAIAAEALEVQAAS